MKSLAIIPIGLMLVLGTVAMNEPTQGKPDETKFCGGSIEGPPACIFKSKGECKREGGDRIHDFNSECSKRD